MKIKKWMTRPVVTIKPLDSIQHARTLMLEHRINQLPVMVKGQLVGIVTDRDLRDAFPSVFSTGKLPPGEGGVPSNPDQVPVEMVMTRDVQTIAANATAEEAAKIMRRQRIGALPVIENDRLVGIIARSDLLDALVAG